MEALNSLIWALTVLFVTDRGYRIYTNWLKTRTSDSDKVIERLVKQVNELQTQMSKISLEKLYTRE